MWKWIKQLWSKLISKGKKKAEDVVDGGDSTTTPVTPATPDAAPPSADSGEAAEGFSHPATVTHQIVLKSVSSNVITFSNPGIDWSGGDGSCNGECQIAWKINGAWTNPEKFDHMPIGGTSRDFKNIYGGYHGLSAPAVGTWSGMILISYDHKYRSNCIFWDWK